MFSTPCSSLNASIGPAPSMRSEYRSAKMFGATKKGMATSKWMLQSWVKVLRVQSR